jgi:hypothetical protein
VCDKYGCQSPFFLKTKKKVDIHFPSPPFPLFFSPPPPFMLLPYVYFNFVECVSSLAYGKTTGDYVCVLSRSLYSPKENKSGTQGRQLTTGSAAILWCGAEHFSSFIPVMQGACPSNTCLTFPYLN